MYNSGLFYFQSGEDRSQFCIKSRVSLMIFKFLFCLNCFESITANLIFFIYMNYAIVREINAYNKILLINLFFVIYL